ncbi:BZ3500_MvSof-1268-A1-R1_Chr5-2g07940 [Microbotryum saponariae]|uniref:BZ3500_MvSof-1268-A1-R1_Chr5-2g07940 protein n=1 Tax=Microbotryum saponariae TaxID=289078 RepID=A0A2X0LIZ3_9BASI|nr:BZ3500_MvSof-1268-A1-R1_Chr5-2g07940 [Microbotryum saponariae]SDA05809.1 BZ3501_MvSof-1269-A2-R1_Chr5-2g07762 [Microbotryum saponariae]
MFKLLPFVSNEPSSLDSESERQHSSVPFPNLHRRTSTTAARPAESPYSKEYDSRPSSNQGLQWRDPKTESTSHYHRIDRRDSYSRLTSPSTPSARHSVRVVAVLGWLVAFVLFLAMAMTNSDAESRKSSVMSLRNVTQPYLETVGKLGSKAGFDVSAFVRLPAPSQPFDGAAAKAHSHSGTAEVVEGEAPKSRVTLISAFYRIDSGKKHRVSEYHAWLSNFLGHVELPIVFYCAPEMRPLITGLRGSKPITIIDSYDTPFDMPPLETLGGRQWAELQNSIDPEQNWHVPDVYGVWTAKPWMVQQVKDADYYNSEYFVWASLFLGRCGGRDHVDAGAFRDSSVKHDFLQLEKQLDHIYSSVPDDTLVLSAAQEPFAPGLDYVNGATAGGELDRSDRLQGGYYGGKAAGIDWWAEETMKVTIRQSSLQKFTAKEQPVWNQAARLNWPRIYVQNMALRQGTDCGSDVWFAFEYFADGRDCTIPVWSGPEHKAKFGAPVSKVQANRRAPPPPRKR